MLDEIAPLHTHPQVPFRCRVQLPKRVRSDHVRTFVPEGLDLPDCSVSSRGSWSNCPAIIGDLVIAACLVASVVASVTPTTVVVGITEVASVHLVNGRFLATDLCVAHLLAVRALNLAP